MAPEPYFSGRGTDLGSTHANPPPFDRLKYFEETRQSFVRWAGDVHEKVRVSQLLESETPMDGVTSSMIGWMVENGIRSADVNTAMKALAGADLCLLPRQPLWDCSAVQIVHQHLKFFQAQLERLEHRNQLDPSVVSKLSEKVPWYTGALNFLIAFVPCEGLDLSDVQSSALVFPRAHDYQLQQAAAEARTCLVDVSNRCQHLISEESIND